MQILEGLGLAVASQDDGWDVSTPSHRFDVALEVDLIEEVARIYGYDRIPEATAIAATPLDVVTESTIDLELAAATLVARDYQEVVTYSFIDDDSNKALTGVDSELVLSNPISSEMSVMRASLLPGMLFAAATNASRQQDRVRLFEIGKSFHGKLGAHDEVLRIAGVATGAALPEQWGAKTQNVDFFDIKADISALLQLAGETRELQFVATEHPALQPGQAARIVDGDSEVGVVGKDVRFKARCVCLRT